MRLAGTLRAVAFIANAAVFLIGVARYQGRFAPPDYVYVGLLFGTALASSFALVLGYRKAVDPEVLATAKIAAYLLNALLLVFALRLIAWLPEEALQAQATWIAVLLGAPVANAAALIPDWRRRSLA
jgi:hypothetical protein